jgi:electron transport complex protein RnfC
VNAAGLFGLKTFRHGVHPPEAKEETRDLAIRQFPFAPLLVVPLLQHTGQPARPVVRAGQEVARGQTIAEPDGFLSVAMHAPASGRVRRIALAPSISGRMVPAVYLEPHPGSTQEVADGVPCPLEAPPHEIVLAIQRAGIVGLGGAAFPTHVKLAPQAGKSIDTLILNGAECEPFLTTDHRVMLEQSDDLFLGIRYLLKVTGAARAIVGVERNKADAAAHLAARLPADLPAAVELLRVKYPQGAEKMLITALLGREVPSGRLPIDVHALVVNVATAAEIGRLLPRGRGIQERVITVTGPAVAKQGNYRIPIGTPLRFLLESVGADPERLERVFLGGPMMGQAASSLEIAITKGTSGVVAFDADLAGQTHRPVYPCIRCGACLDACPVFLNPAELHLLGAREAWERMRDERHLFDCIECGACSFVCPAHLPLVQRFRIAKAALRRSAAAKAVA